MLNFSSSHENFFKISNIDQYQKDFTFIVNGKRYSTSRIIADLLSPIITNNHFNDSTNEEFIINTSNDDDYFDDFLELAQFKKITLDSKKQILFSEIGLLQRIHFTTKLRFANL